MPSHRKPTNFYTAILSGSVNKTSLRIPNRFIRGHRKQILLNDVILIVSDDKVWQLGWMISGDGKLWVQKGWPEFANHYRIGYGHLLLFKHMGKSMFHVTIFDSSNCEINYPPPPSKCPKLQKGIDQSVTQDDQIGGKILFFY
ncbi:B3 DNA binding domain-containing protein [Cynara cardunculus var. scolymus]|uniref:B3 DNA binding domain-containing protein n=1 Tax=Cynara cardunculus var. scolymus TaxID=59895 RepID=A0A103Y502_CYNCS|nr:B3 DNA binding domain-containing protein [Cynara cardunculus var. scolymus]